jgi:sulfide:quinone oxidoreductase
MASRTQVLVLGAGFGGLEVAACLAESAADVTDVTVLDRSAGFTFGFSKLEVLRGRATPAGVRLPYAQLSLPGVEFRQEVVTAIDPVARTVETDRSTYEPDVLVVALGADYEPSATPGFVEDGHEFYSVEGAERLAHRLEAFTGGDLVVAILSVPFKCPPAPYEGVLLMHELLVERGVRDATRMELITPMASPIPVSAPTSEAIVQALADRGIVYTPDTRVHGLDPARHVALLKEGSRPYDLFVGVPVHRVPEVVAASGLTEGGNDGWIAVDRRTLMTPYPGVYALGDCADAPVPRAGVFAESAARVVAEHIAATARGRAAESAYDGTGTCYLEFGDGTVGKVEADFLSGPSPVAPFRGPSRELALEKAEFAETRRRRWFGATG